MHRGDALYNNSQEFTWIALECENMDRTCMLIYITHTYIYMSLCMNECQFSGLEGSSTTPEDSSYNKILLLLQFAHKVFHIKTIRYLYLIDDNCQFIATAREQNTVDPHLSKLIGIRVCSDN